MAHKSYGVIVCLQPNKRGCRLLQAWPGRYMPWNAPNRTRIIRRRTARIYWTLHAAFGNAGNASLFPSWGAFACLLWEKNKDLELLENLHIPATCCCIDTLRGESTTAQGGGQQVPELRDPPTTLIVGLHSHYMHDSRHPQQFKHRTLSELKW